MAYKFIPKKFQNLSGIFVCDTVCRNGHLPLWKNLMRMGIMNDRKQVLHTISRIYSEGSSSRISDSFLEEYREDLDFLAHYFWVTPIQALLIATLFGLSQEHLGAGYNDFTIHFGFYSIEMYEYYEDLEALHDQGIIRRKARRHRQEGSINNHEFYVSKKLEEAILKGEPLEKFEKIKHKDIYEFLTEIEELVDLRTSREMYTDDLLISVEDLMDNSSHIPAVKMIQDLKLPLESLCVFLYLLVLRINGDDHPFFSKVLEDIFDQHGVRAYAMNKLITKEDKLTRNEIVEIEKSVYIQYAEVRLTDNILLSLKEVGLNLYITPNQVENVILPSSIFYKPLFFSPSEQKQIATIKGLLAEEEFDKIQGRLKERGLPVGVNILLHGAPGTGKTESVLQLGKATGRRIMKVDISESKSMWFGESERKIKRIFTDYKSFAKDCDLTPILLINEADALISKRKAVGSSNTAQVENSLQNILLEEMEGFEGILIATTNFVINMDSAFERRFLFKIQLEKPDKNIRAQIWKEKLPNLSSQECEILAERFHLSGGQIDNIVRKKEIHEIVNGETVSLDQLIEYCQQESWVVNPTKIGFSI